MVSALFYDKYLEKFIVSAARLLGYECKTLNFGENNTFFGGDVIFCDEESLSVCISSLDGNTEGIVSFIAVRKKRTLPLADYPASARIYSVDYPIDLRKFGELLRTLECGMVHESLRTHKNGDEPTFDRNSMIFSFKGKHVKLTERETRLFEYLLERRGEVVSRTQLCENVWEKDISAAKTNVTDVYVSYLRKKLDSILGSESIKTVRGEGYLLKI